jgi:hypothetical protein
LSYYDKTNTPKCGQGHPQDAAIEYARIAAAEKAEIFMA